MIPIPTAGFRRNTLLGNQGVAGRYWSRCMHLGAEDAYLLNFKSVECAPLVDTILLCPIC